MEKITPKFWILTLMVFAAAYVRLIPHPPNFAPIAAMALFGGAYFTKKWAAFLVSSNYVGSIFKLCVNCFDWNADDKTEKGCEYFLCIRNFVSIVFYNYKFWCLVLNSLLCKDGNRFDGLLHRCDSIFPSDIVGRFVLCDYNVRII